ncbi:hypothetical protein C8R44DRAFT_873830 [Mycena epipterygia]|nr:hypothetical protein C8R44DRAFT_873830 [Mycena epipterygia]
MTSSFSPTYHHIYQYEDDNLEPLYTANRHCTGIQYLYLNLKPGGSSDQLVIYYLGSILAQQYLLADITHIRKIISHSVTNPGASLEAACLLASIHMQRDIETKLQYNELLQVLKKLSYNEDNMLVAIIIMWSFLFDSGVGADHDPRDTLQHCSEMMHLIIKTAIWFDVLAAITTQQSPCFLHYIRQLYSPETSSIFNPSLLPSEELSMMSIVGCENHIVWAMAEVSALAVWKQDQMNKGRLSILTLIAHANKFIKIDLNPTAMMPLHFSASDTEVACKLSSNIFCAMMHV